MWSAPRGDAKLFGVRGFIFQPREHMSTVAFLRHWLAELLFQFGAMPKSVDRVSLLLRHAARGFLENEAALYGKKRSVL